MRGLAIFILVVLLVYYGTKLIIRYGIPWIIMHYFGKQHDIFKNEREDKKREEGEIRVKHTKRPASKADDKSFGEYIDFEEIDDNE